MISQRKWRARSLVCALGAGVLSSQAQEPRQAAGGNRMDYGPFLSYTINARPFSAKTPDNLALKGIAIKLGGPSNATVCFDTELLRYAAGWTEGFLDLSKTHLTSYKGSAEAFIAGLVQFSTMAGPGWAKGDDFTDPRALPAGPLPRDWARYKGLYRHGEQVVLNYTVGTSEIYETPGCFTTNGITFFTRTLHIEKSDQPLTLRVCDIAPDAATNVLRDKGSGWLKASGQTITLVGVVNLRAQDEAMPAARVEVSGQSRIQITFPRFKGDADFRVIVASASSANPPQWEMASSLWKSGVDPKSLCQDPPARWPGVIETRGKLGRGGPYVVDTLTMPENNPWQSWMRFVAFSFFSDGRAAISTWNGDVWIVSGIDDKLEKLKWKRFASGLFEPLGLQIVDDTIYVLGRDQITRLRDLNDDGEADYYENFNNDTPISPSYHAFAFELQTDRAGNFYFVRCGQRVDPALPLNGGLVKVSRDGSRTELVATGLRAANGMSIGPNDEITTSDNQGNWVPSSRIDLIKPGGFYGYVPHARRAVQPTDFEKPICWLPQAMDNSGGSQAWVTSDQWGPLAGQLLHTSYGKAALFLVLMENVEGQVQGGAVQFPLKFDSGIMRARFHPRDGQLYVCGLKGWQTAGARDGAFHRVRFAGGSVRMPVGLNVKSNGIQIKFSTALEPASATDEQNYAIEQWNYRWTEKYGSPDYSVADPEKLGRDPVAIKSVSLAPEGKTVFLEIPELRPVMQMKIQFRLKAADGSPVASEIYNTINRVPGQPLRPSH